MGDAVPNVLWDHFEPLRQQGGTARSGWVIPRQTGSAGILPASA